MKAGIREVKSKFSHYANLAHSGKTVIVLKNDEPWFDLVPHQAPKRRVSPLKGMKAVVSAKDAIAPLEKRDLPGWM